MGPALADNVSSPQYVNRFYNTTLTLINLAIDNRVGLTSNNSQFQYSRSNASTGSGISGQTVGAMAPEQSSDAVCWLFHTYPSDISSRTSDLFWQLWQLSSPLELSLPPKQPIDCLKGQMWITDLLSQPMGMNLPKHGHLGPISFPASLERSICANSSSPTAPNYHMITQCFPQSLQTTNSRVSPPHYVYKM